MAINVRYDDTGGLASMAVQAGKGDAFWRKFGAEQQLLQGVRDYYAQQDAQRLEAERMQQQTQVRRTMGQSASPVYGGTPFAQSIQAAKPSAAAPAAPARPATGSGYIDIEGRRVEARQTPEGTAFQGYQLDEQGQPVVGPSPFNPREGMRFTQGRGPTASDSQTGQKQAALLSLKNELDPASYTLLEQRVADPNATYEDFFREAMTARREGRLQTQGADTNERLNAQLLAQQGRYDTQDQQRQERESRTLAVQNLRDELKYQRDRMQKAQAAIKDPYSRKEAVNAASTEYGAAFKEAEAVQKKLFALENPEGFKQQQEVSKQVLTNIQQMLNDMKK